MAAERPSAVVSSAVAIGLALPGRAGAKDLDLLPAEVRVERRKRRNERYVGAAAAVLALVLVLTGVQRFWTVHQEQQAVAHEQSTINYLNAQIPRYDRVQQEHSQLLKDEQIAGLMQQADATMDLKARAVVYRQALTRLQEQAYLGTGYNLPFNYVLDARVRGLGAYFSIPNFKAAWVAR